MRAVPLLLSLPDGCSARLVPGSFERGQPRYERDGVEIDVDVTIPDDLEAAGWFWFGSCLYRRDRPEDCGIGIFTGTFPPPLCFDQARELERIRAELEAAPVKRVKVGKGTASAALADVPIVAVPEPELTYEQSEPAQLAMEF